MNAIYIIVGSLCSAHTHKFITESLLEFLYFVLIFLLFTSFISFCCCFFFHFFLPLPPQFFASASFPLRTIPMYAIVQFLIWERKKENISWEFLNNFHWMWKMKGKRRTKSFQKFLILSIIVGNLEKFTVYAKFSWNFFRRWSRICWKCSRSLCNILERQ